MMVVLFLTDYLKMTHLSSLKMALSMILLLLEILLLEALLWNFPYHIYDTYYNSQYRAGVINALTQEYWIFIELVNAAGLIITNVLFLFMRSCCRHKVSIEKPNDPNQLPSTETIIAL